MGFEEFLRVRDIMVVDVKHARPETPLMQVVRTMVENRIGSVVIVNERMEVVGIITEKDLLERVVAKGLDPSRLTAADVMTRPVIVVSPDTPVRTAIEIMRERNIGHLPVVENGRLVGILAEGDVLTLAPQYLELLRIRRAQRRGKRT